MANVAFKRPELVKLTPQYDLIRDAIDGETAVKAKGDKYLPRPNASDDSEENIARYEAYLERAVFYNVTRRTLSGLNGQVFMRDPKITIPASLEALEADATGTGININQLAKQAVSDTLAFSRAGVFVDYPALESDGATVEDLKGGKIRPTMFVYSAHEIINWRTIERGAKEFISLVVLFEKYCFNDDGFEMEHAGQFRVLRLDDSGKYFQQIYREPTPTKIDESSKKIPQGGNFTKVQTFFPRDFSGEPLEEIPFMFIGSENNDPAPDNPNFYDLASLNIAHYRNSADYEEACFIVGQPTLVMTGLTEDWVKDILGGKASMGSRGGLPLPVDADAKLIQAEENTMIKEAMDTKERQMVALGAKLVEQKEVQRTATEAGLESAAEGSTLANVTKNVSTAFVFALKFASRFVGKEDNSIIFELNTDFDVTVASPEQRKTIVSEWQAGAITFTEMRAGLRKAGVATEDDEKAKATIETDTAKAMAMEVALNEPPKAE